LHRSSSKAASASPRLALPCDTALIRRIIRPGPLRGRAFPPPPPPPPLLLLLAMMMTTAMMRWRTAVWRCYCTDAPILTPPNHDVFADSK